VARRFKAYIRRFKTWGYTSLVVLLVAVPNLYGEPAPAQAPIIADDLDRESLRAAIRHSIAYLEMLPGDRIVGEQPRRFSAAEILESLLAFERLLERWDCRECFSQDIFERFELIPSSPEPAAADVLFTGYYQPVIEGSLSPTVEYRHPIYGKPSDLIVAEQVTLEPQPTVEKIVGRAEGDQFLPYYSRREIDLQGSLRGRGFEIAWVKDPMEIFFLQVQGSGILSLQDGKRLHVNYAASNGRPYRSIGRLLIDNGKVSQEEISMQRLRRYLREHPEEQEEILAYNESYVFFRFVEEGPLGSLEVPVTAGRSIATDARIFPKGALAFIVTQKPVTDGGGRLVGWAPFSRFVLNQDTGGAIRGLQRADLYFGTGDQAGAAAGYMNRQGKLFFLAVKNEIASPVNERRPME